MKYLLLVLLFLIFLFFQRCSHHCSCKEEAAATTGNIHQFVNFKIDSESIFLDTSLQKLQRPNPYFGISVYAIKEKLFLVFVSQDGNLVFSNFRDSNDVYRSPFPYIANKNRLVMWRIIGDTLHFINKYDTTYTKFAINPDFSTTPVQKIELNRIIRIPNWFIYYNNITRQFDYRYPYLLMPYGKRNGNRLYDNQSCLLIDTKNLEAKKVLDFPACYSSCLIYNENVSVAIDKSKMYGLFSYYNRFSESHIHADGQNEINLPFGKPFQEYDQKESQNLAYARKYEGLRELNVNIFFQDDGSLIVVKRLSKSNFTDPYHYRIYQYNQNNEVDHLTTIDTPILSNLCIPYRRGFIAVNTTLTKFYYYEAQ